MYSLDHINRIQEDVDNLNKYAIEVGQNIAGLRKVKIPKDTSDAYMDAKTVEIRWAEDCGRGCCSDSYYVDYPTVYLTMEESQYLEAERIIIEQKEETERLQKLAGVEIKEKKKKEEELLTLMRLKAKYETCEIGRIP